MLSPDCSDNGRKDGVGAACASSDSGSEMEEIKSIPELQHPVEETPVDVDSDDRENNNMSCMIMGDDQPRFNTFTEIVTSDQAENATCGFLDLQEIDGQKPARVIPNRTKPSRSKFKER